MSRLATFALLILASFLLLQCAAHAVKDHQLPDAHLKCNHDHEHTQQHGEVHDHCHAHDHSHNDSLQDIDNHTHKGGDHQGSHGHHHHHQSILTKCTFFHDVERYIQEYAPTNYEKVSISVLIISLPSLPIFFGLTLLGKAMRGKNEKTKFSAKLLNLLLAFAFGTCIGDVMLHMLPFVLDPNNHRIEAATLPASSVIPPASCPFSKMNGGVPPSDINHSHLSQDSHAHGSIEESHGHSHQTEVPLLILAGIFLFIVIEYMFMAKHDHNHGHDSKHPNACDNKKKEEKKKDGKSTEQKKDGKNSENSVEKVKAVSEEVVEVEVEEHSSAMPFLISDFMHNFTDGIAVGAAYAMGVMTTLVIMIHELPHEIGDFAHLMKLNYSLSKILTTQFITSLGALIGGYFGIMTGEVYKKELLSITAGGFLYMSLGQILPEVLHELKKEHSFVNLLLHLASIGLGVLLMYEVTLIE